MPVPDVGRSGESRRREAAAGTSRLRKADGPLSPSSSRARLTRSKPRGRHGNALCPAMRLSWQMGVSGASTADLARQWGQAHCFARCPTSWSVFLPLPGNAVVALLQNSAAGLSEGVAWLACPPSPRSAPNDTRLWVRCRPSHKATSEWFMRRPNQTHGPPWLSLSRPTRNDCSRPDRDIAFARVTLQHSQAVASCSTEQALQTGGAITWVLMLRARV